MSGAGVLLFLSLSLLSGPLTSGAVCLLSGMTEFPEVQVENFTLKLELTPLKSEDVDKAHKELRETPELKEKSVKELRDLIREEDGLNAPLDNEFWLVRFLRPTKFYPQSAMTLIRNYYKFKIKHKNLFDGLVPSREENVFASDVISMSPKRDQHGRRITVLTLGRKWNHNKVSLDEIFKAVALFNEAAALEPETQVSGTIVIFDMDGLSMAQALQFTPGFAKRNLDWAQDSTPTRLKGIHIVNQPFIFNMVFKLFKPFLREKLKSRIHFHGTDMKSLHQHVDPSCLFPCYDGTLTTPRIHGKYWHQLLIGYEKEFEKMNSYGYNKHEK